MLRKINLFLLTFFGVIYSLAYAGRVSRNDFDLMSIIYFFGIVLISLGSAFILRGKERIKPKVFFVFFEFLICLFS